jgi:hypothetical protein
MSHRTSGPQQYFAPTISGAALGQSWRNSCAPLQSLRRVIVRVRMQAYIQD